MKKYLQIILIAIFSIFILQSTYTPEQGYVPDKQTAIKIAVAIWLPIYGKKIYKERPFEAYLVKDSVWIVTGTLNKPKGNKDIVGGTAYIEIQKSDGKILRVIHGK